MATYAERQVARYETLLETASGLDTISVDGQSVQYEAAKAWLAEAPKAGK